MVVYLENTSVQVFRSIVSRHTERRCALTQVMCLTMIYVHSKVSVGLCDVVLKSGMLLNLACLGQEGEER